MSAIKSADIWTEFSCSTFDGLTIRGRDYGSRLSTNTPVVCLPGLTRSTRDFDAIARLISQDSDNPRRVLSLDYRGRGQSDYDPNWQNYTPATEAGDVLNAIVAAGMQDVVIFGTSRGGIIAMLLGSIRPGIMSGVILHDIGPTIDITGLLKIKSYLTQMPVPKSWPDAAQVLKTVHKGSFPDFGEDDWHEAARLTFANQDGKPVIDFDPALTKTLANVSRDSESPNLWPQFLSLRSKPLLVIRGGISDLFSAETLEIMDRGHPTMKSVTVPNQGHVPSLMGDETVNAIKSLLKEADANAH